MVKIRWIIVDDIKGISLKEFEKDHVRIYGHFELCVNDQSVGLYPDKELLPYVWGDEDITDWLYKLPNMIVQLKDNKEYQWDLLQMNLLKIVIRKEDMLSISLIHIHSGVMWSEKVTYREFITELLCAIDRFIDEIRTLNSDVLNAWSLKRIIEIRGELSQTPLLDLPDN